MPFVDIEKLKEIFEQRTYGPREFPEPDTTVFCAECQKEQPGYKPRGFRQYLGIRAASFCSVCGFFQWSRIGTKIPQKIRMAVYQADSYECVYCGSSENLSLDHITPYSHGGKDTFENLLTACRSCNSRNSNKTKTLKAKFGRFR